MSDLGQSGGRDPHRISAMVRGPGGTAYRGKFGCKEVLCTRDLREPDRCYGWHCLYCDERSDCQGDCSNPDCPGRSKRHTLDEVLDRYGYTREELEADDAE